MINGNNSAAESGSQSIRTSHTLSIDKRRHAIITGVTDVCSFHETEVVLKLDCGVMILTGQSLHIAKLLLEEGRLDVDGHIDGVIYETPKATAKRLFAWMGHKK
ncbi:MAG: YabP/YqfC family sporulation protein [Clostridiales bacterium]|nr:YabP/YqfC family sporulation protein [Clostridiales bacterium]